MFSKYLPLFVAGTDWWTEIESEVSNELLNAVKDGIDFTYRLMFVGSSRSTRTFFAIPEMDESRCFAVAML